MYFQRKKTIACCTVLVALFPSLAALAAQDGAGKLDPDTAPKRGQYVYDSFGHNTRAGLSARCVDTGFWDSASATVECDPNLFASRAAPTPHTAAAEKPAARSTAASAAVAPATVAPAAVAPAASTAQESQAASASHGNAGTPAASRAAGATVLPATETPAALASTSRPVAQTTAASNAVPANSASSAGKVSVVPVPLAAAPAGDQSGAPAQDQTPARDDGILAQHRYYDEEGGAAKDDGILGSSRYNDEYPGTARGDGISALSQYHDEEGGAAREDGIIAHNIYGNDDSGVKSESLLGQPKTFPQGNETAALAANKPQAITMLPVTITVEADPLFDFDQAAVREDSRKKLDDLIQQLHGVSYGDVIVVGFADPIGTAIYNQSLSWRRAESVEQYLAKHGLPASRIRAEGRGETEEFATFASCGGMRDEHAIACLQPDRRVEVTITAKRQHQASN